MSALTATKIVYPETDGMPLPDGMYQSPIFTKAFVTLLTHFSKVPGAYVNGNIFIYYLEGNPRRSVAPDCFVLLDTTDEMHASFRRNNTYLLWEVGKMPEFVMEIGSPSTASKDMKEKRDLYADLGVKEYWRYDETGGDFYGEPLIGERLTDGEYRRLETFQTDDGRVWSHSEVLNLDLWWEDGELRFWDPVEQRWLLNPQEEHEGRLEEYRGRLEERAGRLAAEARVAELEAQLRQRNGSG